jgi:3-hydroxyisobutyrate dehydrogenase-like beta-hydroxyacid dehydrogenase
VESGQYPPSFKLSLAAKDMRLAVGAAARTGDDLKVAETVCRWLDEAAEHGAGDLDFSAVVATILGQPARR